MTSEYAPGAVAMIRLSPVVDGRAASDGWAIAIRDNVSSWACGAAINRVADDSQVLDTRPLVVIDPEDREQVERLAKAWDDLAETNFPLGDAPLTLRGYRMQAALREYANPTPPKPEEPMAMAAVVEDKTGRHWVRVAPAMDALYCPWHSGIDECDYADIAAVRILSSGVEA